MAWNYLRSFDSEELAAARLNLHYAAQVVSGVGRTLMTPQDDDSHTSMVWHAELGALAGHPAPGERSFRAALDFERFRLLLIDLEDKVLFDSALAGKTMQQAYSWLAEAISARLGRHFHEFQPVHYELPDSKLGEGGSFSFEPASAFRTMRDWYADAAQALEEIRAEHKGSPVRCWPHQFDIATLIRIDEKRTIGVGLSPGDATYNEPYWYVGPSPHPQPEEWPELDRKGFWHTEGFVAAIYKGSDFVKENDQPKNLKRFVDSAIEASRKLLEEV